MTAKDFSGREIRIGSRVMRTNRGNRGETFIVTHFDAEGDPCGEHHAVFQGSCLVIGDDDFITQEDWSGHALPQKCADAKSAAEGYVREADEIEDKETLVKVTAKDGTVSWWTVETRVVVSAKPLNTEPAGASEDP